MDIPQPLQLVDQEAGALLGDPCLSGEIAESAALRRDALEHARLGRRDVVEAGRSQLLEHPRLHRPVGQVQQQSGVELLGHVDEPMGK